jgi:DNA-binding SARP family transcriptional activator
LLGNARVRDRAGTVVGAEAWRTAKSFDLLRVLALSRGAPVANDVLVELFWPAAGPARGGTSLRTAVSHVRRVLGTESIVRADHGLMLDAWVDVDAFRELGARVQAARAGGSPARVVELVRQAEDLYEDDLDVRGSECAWLHEARAELRAERLGLLLDGAEAAGRCADWRQSLVFAQRAADIDVTDRSTRALMRAWYAVGEAAKPVEEFERLRLRLAEDYGVDPAPQTRALYLEIVNGCDEWPPRETVVGREAEVAQVVSAAMAWLLDPEEKGGVVWLVGEPGSGRDAVAQEAGRTMMLPLADDELEEAHGESAHPVGGPTLQRLADQGPLTRGLADMLTEHARSQGRILLVPVTDVEEDGAHERDSVVGIGPLERADFGRMLGLVLQVRPAPELVTELYDQSRGLPGLATQLTRARVSSGDLTWTSRGVDTTRRDRMRTRIVPTLVSIPWALLGTLGVLGSEGMVEVSAKTNEVEQRERRLVSA